MADSLTAGQKRTLAARQTFQKSFAAPEEKSTYYQSLGQRSAEGRHELPASERAALVQAYQLIGEIFARQQLHSDNGADGESGQAA